MSTISIDTYLDDRPGRLAATYYGAAQAVACLHHGITFEALHASGPWASEIDQPDWDADPLVKARIALAGPAIELIRVMIEDAESPADMPGICSRILFGWTEDASVKGSRYHNDLLSTGGRVESVLGWVAAFVDQNMDTIELLAGAVIDARGWLGYDTISSQFGGSIRGVDGTALADAENQFVGQSGLLRGIDLAITEFIETNR